MRTAPFTDWLRLFIPLAVVICAAIYGYGRLEAERELGALDAREQTILLLAGERFSLGLVNASDDLRVIAHAPAVDAYVGGPSPERRKVVEGLMGAFIGQKTEYEKLRLLDASGHEVVRVDHGTASPVAVPDDGLQDLGDQDYFTAAVGLPVGQIHISGFDLDVEHGTIVRPLRPVLRLSMRLKAGEDHPDYVLVANLRGAVLLEGIRGALSTSSGTAWLLDEDGYWLMHPDPAMEWGRQMDRSKRIATHHPQLAAVLARSDAPNFADGTMTLHRHLEPLKPLVQSGAVQRSPRFDLVTRFGPEQLPPLIPIRLWWVLALLLVLSAMASAVLVNGRRRAASAEADARRLIERGAADNEERAWVREHVYQLGLKVYATRDPAEFGNIVLSELAGTLRLVAARLYALRDQQAVLIASFGVSDKTDARSFAPGEGLVGEAARTRQERRMTPPPPGYLDLSTGLAAGPAADLRILPLWVHGRTVGVVELAFVDLLQARQEELLRQTLPLLALNLDGFQMDARRVA